MLKAVFVPINQAGWPFISLFAAMAIAMFLLWEPLGWVGIILTLWCVYFFRDPPRVTPMRDGLIVSPADGVLQMIKCVIPPEEIALGNKPLNRVSIFMNVFDVHVNRIPIGGKISQLAYRPGKFLNASLDKASEFNESQCLRITTNEGTNVGVIQIAGLVARRIKCDVVENQLVDTGERFGLIRFGSRVDVFLPDGISTLVSVGQRMVAGETVIADSKALEKPWIGEK